MYVEDCGHMVVNGTGCFPPSGVMSDGLGQTAASSHDGRIVVDGQVVHECVLASATTGCNTTCCVNPEVTALRKSQEVRTSDSVHRGPCCLPASAMHDGVLLIPPQTTCKLALEVGEFFDIAWSLVFVGYYTWLLVSLVLSFEVQEARSLELRRKRRIEAQDNES